MPILCVCVCIVIGTMQNLMQTQTFDTKCEQTLTDLDTEETGQGSDGKGEVLLFLCYWACSNL